MASANQRDGSRSPAAGSRLLAFVLRRLGRTIVSDVIQGMIAGGVLAFITAQILMHAHVSRSDGWTTMFGCGMPGNGMLMRAACARTLPAVNVPQEAMYWTTTTDGAGQTLSGRQDYILHFPAGQLPPNNAFWSLTMGDAQGRFVANPINRYSVSDHSGLAPNADGSIDIHIQNIAPRSHESNWLPAPEGNFALWLRVYLPGAAILDGEYKVPPVVEQNDAKNEAQAHICIRLGHGRDLDVRHVSFHLLLAAHHLQRDRKSDRWERVR
jgi:hypothetical protein